MLRNITPGLEPHDRVRIPWPTKRSCTLRLYDGPQGPRAVAVFGLETKIESLQGFRVYAVSGLHEDDAAHAEKGSIHAGCYPKP